MRKITKLGKSATKATALALAFVMSFPVSALAYEAEGNTIEYDTGYYEDYGDDEIDRYVDYHQSILDEAKALGITDAYMRHYFASDYSEEKLQDPVTQLVDGEEESEITIKNVISSAGADGLEISKVDTGVLARTKIDLGEFDFGELKAGRVIYNMLAKKNLKGTAYLYADDESEPFAEINIKRCADENWEETKNYTADVRKGALTGKHHIYLNFVANNALDEDGNIIPQTGKNGTLYIESMFFTEGSTPVLDFDLDKEVNTIENINGSENHSIMGYGTMNVEIPEGYVSEYTKKELKDESFELDYIRGRGNSTWLVDKKPYKVKLDKKADLFGMGKNKHWVLLANYYDYSLIRNKYTFYLAEQLGLEYTPKSVCVDVVISGEYCGSYQLCQQVRVGDTRVEINDLEEDPATDELGITGGYLLSMGSSWLTEDESTLETIKTTSSEFVIESPEYDSEYPEDAKKAQLDYINTYMGELELLVNSLDPDYNAGGEGDTEGEDSYADYRDEEGNINYEALFADFKDQFGEYFEDVFGADFGVSELKEMIESQMSEESEYDITLPEGKTWRDYMDEQSYIDYYLLQEFSLNGDSYYSSSTYLYKKRNGKLYWGPVWDFDFVAWAAYATNYTADGGAEGFQMAARNPWFITLIKNDEEFKNKVIERWNVLSQILRDSAADGGYLDQLRDKTYYSALANYQVRSTYLMDGTNYWGGDDIDIVDDEGNPYELNYYNEIERLKNYVNTRADWIDENIEQIDELAEMSGMIPPIEFYVDDELYYEAYVNINDGTYEWPEDPVMEGLVFKGWYYINDEGEEVKLAEGEIPFGIDWDTWQIYTYPVYAVFADPSEIKPIESLGFALDTIYIPIDCDGWYDEEEDSYIEDYSGVYVSIAKFLNVTPFDYDKDDITWSFERTDDEFYEAYIDQRGYLEAYGPCEGVVTATAGDLSASINVLVLSTDSYEFAYSPEDFSVETDINLGVGEYGNVNFKFDGPEDFSVYEYNSISFGVADENIAEVNANGLVYAKAPGETYVLTIRTTEDGMKVKVTKLIVSDGSVSSEDNVDGPKKGTKISDKKYTYKVTKAGSTDGKTVGELQITGLKKKSLKAVKVAATVTIDGVKYNVTSVAKNAFKKNAKITKATIGKNVKTIGNNAFANCKKLKTVVINAKGLKKIGKKAFFGDKKLKKVTLKSTKLKKIGSKAFYRKGGKKLIVKVPKKKKKAYKKLLKKAKTNKYVVK